MRACIPASLPPMRGTWCVAVPAAWVLFGSVVRSVAARRPARAHTLLLLLEFLTAECGGGNASYATLVPPDTLSEPWRRAVDVAGFLWHAGATAQGAAGRAGAPAGTGRSAW